MEVALGIREREHDAYCHCMHPAASVYCSQEINCSARPVSCCLLSNDISEMWKFKQSKN